MAKKALKIGIIAVVAVVALYLIAVLCIKDLFLSRSYLDDVVINSPDQKHTLIIKEWDAVGIGGGGAEIHKKRLLYISLIKTYFTKVSFILNILFFCIYSCQSSK